MYDRALAWVMKHLAAIITAICIISIPFAAYFWGKQVGFEAGKLDQIEEYAKAYALKQAEIDAINVDLAQKDALLQAEIGKVKERVVYKTRTVTEIVNANPEFAAVTRPTELDSIRLQELREIDEAARSRMQK